MRVGGLNTWALPTHLREAVRCVHAFHAITPLQPPRLILHPSPSKRHDTIGFYGGCLKFFQVFVAYSKSCKKHVGLWDGRRCLVFAGLKLNSNRQQTEKRNFKTNLGWVKFYCGISKIWNLFSSYSFFSCIVYTTYNWGFIKYRKSVK